jgi:hypothetical protein
MLRIACFAACLALCGCGGGGSAAPPDMARAPTDHPALWPIQNNGGQVQAAPEIYVVVWQGDEQLGADVAEFADWMLKSDYWSKSLAEYNVGAGVGKGVIVLPTPPPATLNGDEIRALAGTLLTNGQVVGGDNTQIAFAPNPATTVTSPEGVGCQDFAGWHRQLTAPAGAAAYSVSLRCAGQQGSPFDQVTWVLSHEAAEAATDPIPGAGWTAARPSPVAYEIADLCNFNSSMSIDVPADATHAARRYWVQRLYSNQRAALGNVDPCIPVPWDRPYWNVALDPGVIERTTKDIARVDARLDVFAYGDVGAIKWIAVSADGTAEVIPSHGTAHAGDTIPITITLDSSAAGVREIDVLSESEKAGAAMWFSYVEVR